jgi:hypothetical protein
MRESTAHAHARTITTVVIVAVSPTTWEGITMPIMIHNQHHHETVRGAEMKAISLVEEKERTRPPGSRRGFRNRENQSSLYPFESFALLPTTILVSSVNENNHHQQVRFRKLVPPSPPFSSSHKGLHLSLHHITPQITL